jgi:hypothetical protein
MHKYWAGKPWYVVSEYIRHFSREGEIVLDPFCGGGVVGCEALINRRKAVISDLNPVAVFIAKNTCRSPVDLEKFQEEFERIRAGVKDEIVDMYMLEGRCPVCGRGLVAKHVVRGPSLGGEWIVEARCISGHGRNGHIRRRLTPGEKARIEVIESREIPYWFPDRKLPDGREIMRLKNAGMRGVHELFTRRNLIALSMIYHEIQKIDDDTIRDLMLLAFSNTVLHASKLKSESLRPMSANSYYCMGDWIEENVWERFENRVLWRWGVLQGKKETNRLIGDYFRPAGDCSGLQKDRTFLLLNRPAQDLSEIPCESVDYCFTDPPYGGSIQYSELTLLWRSWLKMGDDFAADEITINDFQAKSEEDFEEMLTRAFLEIYRVLKPGRWLSVTFNNRDHRVWCALLNACRAAGFEMVNIVPQEPLGRSFVQSWSGNSLKRDLILNFRKPGGRRAPPWRNQTAAADDGGKIPLKGGSGDAVPCGESLRCRRAAGPLPVKDIILTSAGEYLSKNGDATLPELFEAAIMKWINLAYGGANPGGEGTYFDMNFVDRCLSETPGFIRKLAGNGVCYSLSQPKRNNGAGSS